MYGVWIYTPDCEDGEIHRPWDLVRVYSFCPDALELARTISRDCAPGAVAWVCSTVSEPPDLAYLVRTYGMGVY